MTSIAEPRGADDRGPPEVEWGKLAERLAVELGTPLIFLVALAMAGLETATILFIIASVVVAAISWARKRHFPMIPAGLAVLAIGFGALTIALDDPRWIQMRATVVNGAAAAAIVIGLMRGRLVLMSALQDGFRLDDDTWRVLSWRMAIFLAVLAVANEIVWRSFSTETWAVFKTLVPLLNAGFIGVNLARVKSGLQGGS